MKRLSRISSEQFSFLMSKIVDPKGLLKSFYSVDREKVNYRGGAAYFSENGFDISDYIKEILKKPMVIDPGHIGGLYEDFRKIEINKNIIIQEGNLALKTAQYLQDYLKKNHLSSILTRNDLLPVTKIKIDDMKIDRNKSLDLLKLRNIKRRFNDINIFLRAKNFVDKDILARSDFINKSKSKLAISVHFSGDLNKVRTTKNGIFTIIAGNFNNEREAELDLDRRRQGVLKTIRAKNEDIVESEFKRIKNLVLSGNLLVSYELAKLLVKEMKSHLNLKEVAEREVPEFHKVEDGVYAASLILTKNVKMPLVITEGPYQNNIDEIKSLYANDSRIKSYAAAISAGIVKFINSSNPLLESFYM